MEKQITIYFDYIDGEEKEVILTISKGEFLPRVGEEIVLYHEPNLVYRFLVEHISHLFLPRSTEPKIIMRVKFIEKYESDTFD